MAEMPCMGNERGMHMKELTLEATVENINRVTEFADEFLEELDCPLKSRMQLDIAIDELFGNIARYAYEGKEGEATVRLAWCEKEGVVELSFIDQGMPFDPLKQKEPDITLSAEERAIGGLGIHMVKKNMDDMEYEYTQGENRLTIRKRIR